MRPSAVCPYYCWIVLDMQSCAGMQANPVSAKTMLQSTCLSQTCQRLSLHCGKRLYCQIQQELVQVHIHLTVSIRLTSAHMQTAHPQSTCGVNAASTMYMGQSHSIQQVKHKKADQCAYQGRCYCQQHDLESCFVDSAAAAVAAAGHAWLHAWRHKPLASFLQTHLLLLPHQLLHMPACYLYQPHQTGQMVAWLNPHHPWEHAGVGNLTAYGLCLCPACQSCAPGLM